MPTKFYKKIVEIPKSFYTPSIDSFGAIYPPTGEIEFTPCREQLLMYYDLSKNLYFTTRKVNSIYKMLRWLESKLNLKVGSKLYRFKHKKGGCLGCCIELDPFWLSSDSRKGFLTIAIRAAQRISKGKPLDKLKKISYCQNTRLATILFLDGCTSDGESEWESDHDIWDELTLSRPSRSQDRKFFLRNNAKSKLNKKEGASLVKWLKPEATESSYLCYTDEDSDCVKHLTPALKRQVVKLAKKLYIDE